MKNLLKMLRILPVVKLLKRQKSVIEALRKQLEFTEKWVAVADFNHGLAEERTIRAEGLMKLYEEQNATYKELCVGYVELIESKNNTIENYEKMIENRNKMVELLQGRLDAHGL